MQTVILKTDKSKTEVISILKANIEPWHKDGSVIPLEGTIDDDGNFNLKKAHNEAIRKEEDAGLRFIGSVSEENSQTLVLIKLKIEPLVFALYVIILCVGIIMAVCIYNYEPAKGAKQYPGFVPLLFFAIFPLVKYYYTHQKVKNNTLKLLQILLSVN